MLELTPLKKNKVNLADYDSQKDIANRMMLADFTVFEHRVLEEILFSSLKISLKKFCKSLDCSEKALTLVIDKLVKARLLSLDGDTILVDKDMRKYFECEIARFDPDFKPDMEFLQDLLKKVPIHVLPNWYAIPRTSSNIFSSILEKYLFSPQIFNRYLAELQLSDTKIQSIIRDVYAAPQFQITSTDLIARYNLSRKEFEEILLFLEFHFVCCLSYVKEDDHWIEVISPFYEWRQYLLFLQQTTPKPLEESSVIPRAHTDFSFVKDLSAILTLSAKQPIALTSWDLSDKLPLNVVHYIASSIDLASFAEPLMTQQYLTQAIKKLCLIHLARVIEGHLHPAEPSKDWLNLSLENKAAYLHRHPINRVLSYPLPSSLNTEKYIHEAEKSIKRVIHGEWVYFEDFLSGVLVSFDEHTTITLKKTGKTWRYTLPKYSEEQKMLIKAVVFEWLFEAGMIDLGTTLDHCDCFRVTSFGRSFFGF